MKTILQLSIYSFLSFFSLVSYGQNYECLIGHWEGWIQPEAGYSLGTNLVFTTAYTYQETSGTLMNYVAYPNSADVLSFSATDSVLYFKYLYLIGGGVTQYLEPEYKVRYITEDSLIITGIHSLTGNEYFPKLYLSRSSTTPVHADCDLMSTGSVDTNNVSIEEFDVNRVLIKTYDLLGRIIENTESYPGQILIYQYSDGTVEKKVNWFAN